LGKDRSVYAELKKAAEDMVSQGVRAVTGDCGFMAVHQGRLARELDVPVFLSSLLQIPFILTIVGQKAKVGVISADSQSLDAESLAGLGIHETDQLVIEGLQHEQNFYQFAIEEVGTLDAEAVEKEVVTVAKKIVQKNRAVQALLLECSLLPPYAAAVQDAIHLPVFDYVTMINYVFNAVVRRPFSGFI
jgi:hypothetical protein